MKISRKAIKRTVKLFLLFYALIGLAFYYLQDRILLHPQALPRDYAFPFKQSFEEKFLALNKEDTIHLLRFLPDTLPAKGAVIYWHGNRKNVEHYAPFTSRFTKQGYEVWMPDYPGFGKSTGAMNEKKLYQIGDQVMKLVQTRFSKDSIIIYGKSFGTGVASYLASYSNCKALILETPYHSMHTLLRRYLFLYPVASMANYELPVWKFVEESRSPVTVIHGMKDGVIFYGNAGKLKDHLKKTDRFISIPEGSHNDLVNYPLYQKVIDSILSR